MSVASRWTHLLCDDCWKLRHPGRVPVRCGFATNSGIFVRVDPREMPCGGERKPHEVGE